MTRPQGNMSTDSTIEPRTSGEAAESKRAELTTAHAKARRELIATEQEIESARADLEARKQELLAEFAKKEAALNAKLAPLKAELDRLQETVWTVNLYLGRSEDITQISDGEPAPADTPISIRQQVLHADEESLINVEDGGIDSRSMGQFIDWLAADRARWERIIPDRKGVVALRASRQQRRSGSTLVDLERAKADAATRWLIRNGDRLYLMTTDYKAGDTLIPRRDEFVKYFHVRTFSGTRPLEPGTDEWLRAEENADAARRHFMRAMLILQGLVDRTVVFHPLPEGGINLMSLRAQDDGKVRLVNDLDDAIEDGRPTFGQWQHRLLSTLTVGERIIVDASQDGFRYLRPEGEPWRHTRITPDRASHPPKEPIRVTGGNPSEGFRATYPRTDEIETRIEEPVPGEPGYVYRYWGMRPAKTSATVSVHPSDSWALPFDAATVEDLEYYLRSRRDRAAYLDMVPVIRTALALKQAEAAAEAPFRLLMTGYAMNTCGLPPDAAEEAASRAINEYKLGRKEHRAISEDDTAAAERVTATITAIANAVDPTRRVSAATPTARELLGDGLIAITSTRAGVVQAYAVEHHAPKARITEGYLRQITFTAKGQVKADDRWVRLTDYQHAVRTAHVTTPEWEQYRAPSPHTSATGPVLDAAVDRLRDLAASKGYTPTRITVDSKTRLLTAVCWDTLTPPTEYEPDWRRHSEARLNVRFDAAGKCGEAPWARSYSNDPLWEDTENKELVETFERIDRDKHTKRLQAADARRAVTQRWVQAAQDAWDTHCLESAHKDFVDEYGADADDLWEHHREKILRLPKLPDEVARAINDLPVDATPRSLAEAFAKTTGGKALLGKWPWLEAVPLASTTAATDES